MPWHKVYPISFHFVNIRQINKMDLCVSYLTADMVDDLGALVCQQISEEFSSFFRTAPDFKGLQRVKT